MCACHALWCISAERVPRDDNMMMPNAAYACPSIRIEESRSTSRFSRFLLRRKLLHVLPTWIAGPKKQVVVVDDDDDVDDTV